MTLWAKHKNPSFKFGVEPFLQDNHLSSVTLLAQFVIYLSFLCLQGKGGGARKVFLQSS